MAEGTDTRCSSRSRNRSGSSTGPQRRQHEAADRQIGLLRLKRKDGSIVICLDTSRAICDDHGGLLRLQGALFDVTARRQVEERLQKQEEFGRRLVESFPDLILALDREGRYTFVSPRVREILGYEPEMFIGRSMISDQTPVAAVELQALFQKLITGKEIFQTAEYGAQHRDGTWRALRATASPLFDSQGKLAGVVASVRDVTSVKQMEQQLIQTERLAAMGQMIDGFALEIPAAQRAIGENRLFEKTSQLPAKPPSDRNPESHLRSVDEPLWNISIEELTQ